MAIEREDNQPKRLSQEELKDSIDLALKEGFLKSFVLKGSDCERNNVHFVANIREIEDDGEMALFTFIDEENGFTREHLDEIIEKLSVPPVLRRKSISFDDKPAFDYARKALYKKGTPLIILEAGESERTELEKIVIFIADGLSIETAVSSLKKINQESKKDRGSR